ncbi:hypothetical protein QO012_001362 [Methylobacterium aerolatum]|uniref:Uncharacterized protein n=1 Tax=Methylobacterium aerolatum TaxID=418708 RepID=A0ABU0HX37_9HYPH|nr:hypothetical protein [Methylobacterium aerolatum]MDQ0446871.1 hypothetical protein [Methylobacterium aerolatum]
MSALKSSIDTKERKAVFNLCLHLPSRAPVATGRVQDFVIQLAFLPETPPRSGGLRNVSISPRARST